MHVPNFYGGLRIVTHEPPIAECQLAKRPAIFQALLLRSLMLGWFACGVWLAEPSAGQTPSLSPEFNLPGTKLLRTEGDIASAMVDGVDRFLLREIQATVEARGQSWQFAGVSRTAFDGRMDEKRNQLAHMLGLRDERVKMSAPEWIATTRTPALLAQGDRFDVFAVRWPVLEGVTGEGLLLLPKASSIAADVIVIPDADQTPEQSAGLDNRIAADLQFARRLAESGHRVIVPALISRELAKRAPAGQPGRANLTNREYIYRSAFELGRHIIGYELQKILACVDWYSSEQALGATERPLGVVGYGEGGMLALYAAAIDPRIDIACVSGYFGPREAIWREPIDRNVFGHTREFGVAELAALVFPRTLIVDFRAGPSVDLPSEGGAPGRLAPISIADQKAEVAKVLNMLAPLSTRPTADRGSGKNAAPSPEHSRAIESTRLENAKLGVCLFPEETERIREIQADSSAPETVASGFWDLVASGGRGTELNLTAHRIDPAQRQRDQLAQLDRYNQTLLHSSPQVRHEFMSKLDTSTLAAYQESVESYRSLFRDEVIGSFDQPLLPLNARSRRSWESDRWTAYEVMLDVFPDVFAYGVLLIPKGMERGERRPVVVCQHGLEGRPTDVFLGDHRAYHDFAAALCERGFITFAPQNLYIFKDRFRGLQRKANPLGKTLFSVMIPQHQQIVNWLKQLSIVDPSRIAFYGLSYGGKSAMRIPAVVTDYCLSICSADFNEWVIKNATTRESFSYVWTGEYEIFEWDLGSTFNYAEMAALICPRPFMVERGHFDGVGTDEWVAYEYAKVRRLYQAQLGIGDRTEIEWFVGPHTINGQGTFEFLHRHLDWPKPN